MVKCKHCKAPCIWKGGTYMPEHGCLVGYVPMTNADRIRAMMDEELAELLRDTQCNTCAWQGNDCDYADECKAEKFEMLKQEAAD